MSRKQNEKTKTRGQRNAKNDKYEKVLTLYKSVKVAWFESASFSHPSNADRNEVISYTLYLSRFGTNSSRLKNPISSAKKLRKWRIFFGVVKKAYLRPISMQEPMLSHWQLIYPSLLAKLPLHQVQFYLRLSLNIIISTLHITLFFFYIPLYFSNNVEADSPFFLFCSALVADIR